MEHNAKLTAVKTSQGAIPELGREGKEIYFLQIETTKGKHLMNVGKETYEKVTNLTNGQTTTGLEKPAKRMA